MPVVLARAVVAGALPVRVAEKAVAPHADIPQLDGAALSPRWVVRRGCVADQRDAALERILGLSVTGQFRMAASDKRVYRGSQAAMPDYRNISNPLLKWLVQPSQYWNVYLA